MRVMLIEDNASRAERRPAVGVAKQACSDITIRIHEISNGGPRVLATAVYPSGALRNPGGRAAVAFRLLDTVESSLKCSILVAGTTYGSNRYFLSGLVERRIEYAVELPPSSLVRLQDSRTENQTEESIALSVLLPSGEWSKLQVVHPATGQTLDYLVTDFGTVTVGEKVSGRLVVIQTGGVRGLHPGTCFVLASCRDADPESILQAVGWARWIRPIVRRQERPVQETFDRRAETAAEAGPLQPADGLRVRVNIALARQQDEAAAWKQQALPFADTELRGSLAQMAPELNVVELFAGAGGMGLGFLLAAHPTRRYRLVFSGEVEPIYAER